MSVPAPSLDAPLLLGAQIEARAAHPDVAGRVFLRQHDRTWTFRAWALGIYVDLNNIYNAQNPEGTIYDYRCRTSLPIRGVPFYPILGIKGIF